MTAKELEELLDIRAKRLRISKKAILQDLQPLIGVGYRNVYLWIEKKFSTCATS